MVTRFVTFAFLLAVLMPAAHASPARASGTDIPCSGAILHVHAPPHARFYPPGTPAAGFPLYPGGQRDRSRVRWPGLWYDSHAFMKTGKAKFLLPVSPAVARAWYEAAFTACGFHLDGSHPKGGNPPQPWAAIFEDATADRGTMLALQAIGANESRAFYFGWLVTPPPRLPASRHHLGPRLLQSGLRSA